MIPLALLFSTRACTTATPSVPPVFVIVARIVMTFVPPPVVVSSALSAAEITGSPLEATRELTAAGADWQVHVYGTANQQLVDWCTAQGIPLTVFRWSPAHEEAGLARDAVYLLRPDTYVGLADPSGSAEAIERYLSAREIRLMGSVR